MDRTRAWSFIARVACSIAALVVLPAAAQSPFLNPRLFVSPSIPASLATVNLRINDQTGVFAEVEEQSIQVSGFAIEVRARSYNRIWCTAMS